MRQYKSSLIFIFITVLIDVIGIGIIIPVLPSFIDSLTGQGFSNAARIGGWLMFAYAGMQFFCAPLLGELSDRFGRRPIILIALFGLGIDYLFHAFAPSLAWLFVGRVLAGITGASFTVAGAYIADISTPEKKAQNFGLLGAAFGLGFIIGPVIGGVAAQWGVRMPFFVAAGLSLLNFLYGLFVLPESLPKEKRRPIELRKANPFTSLMYFAKKPIILSFMVVLFLVYIAGQAVQSTWSFYTMPSFGWTEAMVGYSLAIVGVTVAVVQGGLVKKIVALWGEQRTVIYGAILWALGMFLFAFATESWMMFAFIIPYCLGGVAGPTLQSIISNQVSDREQGKLQGALTSLMSLTTIIGPPLMTFIFYYFTQEDAPFEFPGAAFFSGALLMVLSVILLVKPLRRATTVPPEEEPIQELAL